MSGDARPAIVVTSFAETRDSDRWSSDPNVNLAVDEGGPTEPLGSVSMVARARNYLQANYRSIDFRFEIQT
jgi:hypothetical protein